MMSRLVLSLGICSVLFTPVWLMAATALTPAQQAQAKSLYAQLRCVVCGGQSLDSSHADIAVEMRAMIRDQLAQGASEAQVLAFFSDRYGPDILMNPPLEPATYPLWFAPILMVFAGGVVLYFRQRRTTA